MKYHLNLIAILFLLTLHCSSAEKVRPEPEIICDTDLIRAKIRSLLTEEVTIKDKNDYPKIFGSDSRNEKKMHVVFHCTEPCDHPMLFLFYQNVGEEECTRINGTAFYHGDGKTFLGCEPGVASPGLRPMGIMKKFNSPQIQINQSI